MRLIAILPLLLLAVPSLVSARSREIPFDQARQVALLVARHDHITIDDRDFVLNSMDTRSAAGFIPGYYSFSIIRESDSPSVADQTIRMYVISKRTAETWELNLCNRYSFPALETMQKTVMRETGATRAEDPEMPKDIGCRASDQAEAQPHS